MDFPHVQAQLNDLPATFKRIGAPYTQLIDALTGALFAYTNGGDSLLTEMINFAQAMFSILDIWGAVFGILRRPNEGDIPYAARMQKQLLAQRSSPVAMLTWLATIEMLANPQLTENLPNVGYSLTLPAGLMPKQVQMIVNNLAYVRPAGVPFSIAQRSNGPFVDTVNYLGAPRTTGAYIAGNQAATSIAVPSSTNNASPILPDLLLTDPTLNPSL